MRSMPVPCSRIHGGVRAAVLTTCRAAVAGSEGDDDAGEEGMIRPLQSGSDVKIRPLRPESRGKMECVGRVSDAGWWGRGSINVRLSHQELNVGLILKNCQALQGLSITKMRGLGRFRPESCG